MQQFNVLGVARPVLVLLVSGLDLGLYDVCRDRRRRHREDDGDLDPGVAGPEAIARSACSAVHVHIALVACTALSSQRRSHGACSLWRSCSRGACSIRSRPAAMYRAGRRSHLAITRRLVRHAIPKPAHSNSGFRPWILMGILAGSSRALAFRETEAPDPKDHSIALGSAPRRHPRVRRLRVRLSRLRHARR